MGAAVVGEVLGAAAGEVLGVADGAELGVVLGEALVGNDSIKLGGMAIGQAKPGVRRRLGVAVVPEERLGRGAVPSIRRASQSGRSAA